ncbi:MAG: HRDC domain-containing protein [Egibacteraceae bacterium]
MPLEQYALVDDPGRLIAELDSLAGLDPVGVDVERADSNRYFRAAALIQVGGAGRVALIDPLALADLAPLEAFLTERLAVFHALENDVQPLESLGVRIGQVADTAIAAALLGLPTGLESLLFELLGVELAADKSAMQRADWEARPMEEGMLAYAAADVADLPALWADLDVRLHAAGRFDWYVEELAARLAQPAVEDRRDWRRTRGIGRLDTAALARVRALWDIRETLAKTTDTAPGRIASDKTLVDLATNPPKATRELGRRGMRRQAVRDFGDALLTALADVSDAPSAAVAPRTSRRVTDEDRSQADRLRVLRARRAEELGIEAGVLCPSRVLMTAVLTDPTTPEQLRAALDLRDWQWDQLADVFGEALDFGSEGTGAGEEPTA